MKTYHTKAKEIVRSWNLLDAKGEILGRLATKAASMLMGKHKVTYSAHVDIGDYVVIVNSEKIKLSGKKTSQKVYRSHSGYPGGFKEVSFAKLSKESPAKVIELAISGMLPGNRLKRARLERLKVLVGERNPYEDKFKENGKN
ncbi:50S ribosomal protein L13 [Candidatus Woesebacteria bacterium RIFCSPHIGHO2_12_FULL_42_9]|uniref:Large ribosomal subunit protein uL13 n=3 Tax=Candidatus Woeseibacteriota TaxID=1752722 RepID=A0A1F8AWS2_9BACT|nr:MAG: 50S ribosomal protein L13 [Candidatus Woesebacteria bacterium GWA1_42_12]OGM06135.1 MAG: 50S ribosomal protein L13 [Candidatus Woesebacteria bacterium GWC1_42_13]OGM56176.1 MAG: 50S ribosomal protein L13 [Candidatus Woesebacteria bacterium RIFCSPHIGHO2_12_FULL_42_9]